MKTLRAIPMIFALVAFCATVQVARAQGEAESTESVQAAQAQSGDNRPATLGDFRDFEARIDARMSRMEQRMDERINRLESRMMRMGDHMIQMFMTLIMVMLALFGMPHFPAWWNRLRANGKPATIAGVFLIAVVVLTAGAAIAGKF